MVIVSVSRVVAASLCALVLGACQPSLGSRLPMGAAAYDTIALPPSATVEAPYQLRSGDRVGVSVFQEPELSVADAAIDQQGMLSLPLIGQVQAEGRTAPELTAEIQRLYGSRFLRDPKVNVQVRPLDRPRTIAIEGQVTRPGVFPVEPGYTLLTTMALAGSPAPDARLSEVLVFRTVNGQRLGGRFDLTEIRSGRMPDPQIVAGDVIVVGYSSLRGAYRDILQVTPLLGLFNTF